MTKKCYIIRTSASITGLSAGCCGDWCISTHLWLVARHLLFSKILFSQYLCLVFFKALAPPYFCCNVKIYLYHGNRKVNFISHPWLSYSQLQHYVWSDTCFSEIVLVFSTSLMPLTFHWMHICSSSLLWHLIAILVAFSRAVWQKDRRIFCWVNSLYSSRLRNSETVWVSVVNLTLPHLVCVSASVHSNFRSDREAKSR